MSRRHVARLSGPEPGRIDVTPAAGGGEDVVCPGQCNAAFRLAEDRWASTGEDHDVPYHPGRPVWCVSVFAPYTDYGLTTTVCVHEGCTDRIAQALTDMGRWLRDVPASGGLSMADPGERRESASPPSPSPAFDERDAFARWLREVSGRLASRVGHSQPARGRELEYLAQWLSPLLAGPDALRDGQAILSWERRLRSIVGAQTVARLPGACTACGARGSLRHRNGDHLVSCRHCSLVMSWDAYHSDIAGIDAQGNTITKPTASPRRTA